MPASSYRIVGDGIRNSAPFALSAHAGQHEVLAVSEGSKGAFVLGVIGTAGGGAATLTGLLMVVIGEFSKSAAQTENPFDVPGDERVITVGWVTAAIGVAVLVGGIALTISNANTRVSQEVAATPARAPTASGRWAKIGFLGDTSRDTAVALPPIRGIPLVEGRF